MLAMFKTCSEDKKKRIWSFLLGSALRRFICLFAVGLFLVGVANKIGNFETLNGRKSVFLDVDWS